MQDHQQNLIYLYDLPKDEISCNKIADAFKENAQVTLDSKPQIKRDITRPFYTAMVSIKDPAQFEQACEKMRYFTINDKPCRALPFDRQLLGSNKEKLTSHNVFVKLPKEIKHTDLQRLFEQSGKIKSLKVSLNPDYSSRGYGFICFQEEDGATNALTRPANDGIHVMKFEPKDRRSLRKLINNIYVKNIPKSMSEEDLRKLFESYGNVKSLVVNEHDIGKFCFVCYDDPSGKSKEYGPECAQKAIDELDGRTMEDGAKLVVKHALKKAEREVEKVRETIRYKASKKRCNLYVKNFPNNWTKDQITLLFKPFGEIENIRLDHGKTGNAFAFVCFKEPTDAAKAKQTLQNNTVEGKMLIINYYEIKEVRKMQVEEARDKADWEKYQAQQTGGLKWNDLTSQPHLAQMLQQLLGIIQINEQANAQNFNDRRNQRGQDRGYQNRQHQQRPHHNNFNQQQQMPSMGQNMNPQMMQMRQQQQQQQMATQQPQPVMQPQPQMPQMPQVAAQQNVNPQQMTPAQRYMMATTRLLPAVTEKNPHLKDQVGQCIFDYIVMLVGHDKAPKITGMLIELPVQQIKQYMTSFDGLMMKVQEANEHLMNASGGASQDTPGTSQ